MHVLFPLSKHEEKNLFLSMSVFALMRPSLYRVSLMAVFLIVCSHDRLGHPGSHGPHGHAVARAHSAGLHAAAAIGATSLV